MSLAKAAASATGAVLHLAKADTGGIYCNRKVTKATLYTWRPEEVTCKRCAAVYREWKQRYKDR